MHLSFFSSWFCYLLSCLLSLLKNKTQAQMNAPLDQNKVTVALDWITKLANGMNPIDGSILPDSDIVNNVHISRCLFFVSNLLEEMGRKKPSQQKQYESEFKLTPEAASKVFIAERTGIAMFVKEILVTSGPTWKRFMPRSQGRAFRIEKPLSHITVVVANKE